MNNSKCVRLIGSEMFLVGSDMFFLRMEMALLGNYMLLPGNNSTVGKLSQISMLCGQTELLIKERCFNKTRSGYVNSLFFVFCLAQAATRTQSFAIEERRPRPKGLRDVKRGKRRMKKQAETFYQGYETSRPHATSGWRGPFTRLFFFWHTKFQDGFHETSYQAYGVRCLPEWFILFVCF